MLIPEENCLNCLMFDFLVHPECFFRVKHITTAATPMDADITVLVSLAFPLTHYNTKLTQIYTLQRAPY